MHRAPDEKVFDTQSVSASDPPSFPHVPTGPCVEVIRNPSGNTSKLVALNLDGAKMELQATSVRTLFQTKASLLAVTTGLYSLDSYDVTGDGRKFLVNVVATEDTAAPLSLVQNWTDELKNKRPDSH